MLEHVNHPFICNLRYSFQDIEYMYVLCHDCLPSFHLRCDTYAMPGTLLSIS